MYATCQHHLESVFYFAESGKQSAIGLECLFCECSSRAGILVVTRKGCLQIAQTILFAASFDLDWLLAPFGAFFSALRSRFCCALAPFPIPRQCIDQENAKSEHEVSIEVENKKATPARQIRDVAIRKMQIPTRSWCPTGPHGSEGESFPQSVRHGTRDDWRFFERGGFCHRSR